MAKVKASTFREPTKTANLDKWYRRQLRKVSKMVDVIAREAYEETDPEGMAELIQTRLFSYRDTLDAWARDVSATMLKRAAQADYDVWKKVGKDLSTDMKRMLKKEGVGTTFAQLQGEQVDLIKSIPQTAAERVHEWAQKAMTDGTRPDVLAAKIRDEIGGVSESHAMLIARTETARARSNFTQARAKAVGSTGYIWHAVKDSGTRSRHRELDGTVQRWDAPPITDYGKGGAPIRSAPGCIFNCRCWAEPIFPEEIK